MLNKQDYIGRHERLTDYCADESWDFLELLPFQIEGPKLYAIVSVGENRLGYSGETEEDWIFYSFTFIPHAINSIFEYIRIVC